MKKQLFQSIVPLALCIFTTPFASHAIAPDVNGCTPSTLLYSSGEINLPVGAGNVITSTSSTINVPGLPVGVTNVSDVDVITNITHTYSADLEISVTPPNLVGPVRLTSRNGREFDNVFNGTVWDDQADDPVREHSFTSSDLAPRLSPEVPLVRANTYDPQGLWTITVDDLANQDQGVLKSWALRITYCAPFAAPLQVLGTPNNPTPIPQDGNELILPLTLPADAKNVNGALCQVSLITRLTHPALDEISIELESPNGNGRRATVTKLNKIQNSAAVDIQWNSLYSTPAKDAFTSGGGGIQAALSPDESFALFSGENPAGTWKLHVKDVTANGSAGTFNSWQLNLGNCSFLPLLDDQAFPAVEELTPNGSVVGTLVAQEIFNIGKKDNSGPGLDRPNLGAGLFFSVQSPITIRSATFFPQHSGPFEIALRPFINASVLPKIASVSQNVGAEAVGGRLAVPLNFLVNPTGQFNSNFDLEVTDIAQGNLIQNTDVDFSPFVIPGAMKIEFDNSLGIGKYSGLFNWEVAAPPQTLNYIILGGNTNNAFALNPSTGAVTVANTDAIRFASQASYALSIRATSLSGTFANATLTIPIAARAKPKITCPSNTTVSAGASTSAAATGSATAIDVKDITVTPFFSDTVSSANCPLKQKIFREWKAFDNDGNSDSCTQTITVSETITDDRNGNGILECDGELGTTDISGQCVPGAGDCIYEKLRSTACGGANGFLGQVNIASVINLQPGNLGVTVQYIDAGGSVRGQVGTTIAPNLKTDFIINDLGLQPDTIGTVCVTTTAGGTGAWTGGISIYKPDVRNGATPFGTKFDFALYYPFLNPASGTTTTPLNTFHLGTSPIALVANWISIIDAVRGDGQGVSGVINVFSASGQVLQSLSVNLPDGGRSDFPGHEALAGAQNADAVGLAQFVPSNGASYYMTLTRYFYDCPGASCTNFLTAFNIPKRPGSAQAVSGQVSTFDGELAIVELNNVTTTDSAAVLDVFGSSGGSAGQTSIPVPPRATRHVIVNNTGQSGFLASNEVGSTKVKASSGSLSALSIFYKLDPVTGVLKYAYAAPLVESPGVSQLSQFNTFIGHSNRIELINTNTVGVTVQVSFFDYTGANILNTGLLTLASNQTKRLDTSALPKDSYGTFTVNAGAGVIVRNYVSRSDDYTVPFLGE